MAGCCVDKKYGKGCTEATCMVLPAGKTCADCRHLRRCLAFGFTASEHEPVCSFFPRRFLVVAVAAVPTSATEEPHV